MASGESDTPELKGGHAPAVKTAGGMRVAQHKPPKASGDVEPPAEDTGEEEEEQVVVKEVPPSLVVSGFVTKGDKDFPPEAVKVYHDKPQPTHDKRPAHQPVRNIQQPRK